MFTVVYQRSPLPKSLELSVYERLRSFKAVQDRDWLTTKEAAAYLRVSRGTLYNLVRRGVIKWYAVPGLRGRWYRRTELDELRQQGGQPSG